MWLIPETCASSEALLSNVHNGMFEKAGEAEEIFCAFETDFRKFLSPWLLCVRALWGRVFSFSNTQPFDFWSNVTP